MPNDQRTTTTPELQPNVITPTPTIDPQARSPVLSPRNLFQSQEFEAKKSTTEIQTYLDLEGHKEQTPNRNPTALDVYSHMRFLGKELAIAGTRVELGGYAFIIDNLTKWRHRIGDPIATLPIKPILPPKPNNSNTGEWKRFDIIEKEVKEFNIINKQALKYIQHKFPTMLIDMEDPVYATLPGDLTPRQAYQHMLESLLDERTERSLFIKVQKQMANLDYTY